MSEETQELRQSILNRLDASRKAVEEFSEEELESITGGMKHNTEGVTPAPHSSKTLARIPSERSSPVWGEPPRELFAYTKALGERSSPVWAESPRRFSGFSSLSMPED